jgi:hypothetical protein
MHSSAEAAAHNDLQRRGGCLRRAHDLRRSQQPQSGYRQSIWDSALRWVFSIAVAQINAARPYRQLETLPLSLGTSGLVDL